MLLVLGQFKEQLSVCLIDANQCSAWFRSRFTWYVGQHVFFCNVNSLCILYFVVQLSQKRKSYSLQDLGVCVLCVCVCVCVMCASQYILICSVMTAARYLPTSFLPPDSNKKHSIILNLKKNTKGYCQCTCPPCCLYL